MSEKLTLVGRNLETALPAWQGEFGLEVISNRRWRIEPLISEDPAESILSTLTSIQSEQYTEASKKYNKEGYANKELLSLQACSLEGGNIDLTNPGETHFTEAYLPSEKRRGHIQVGLTKIPYFLHLAWMDKAIENLPNPNGLIVSIDCQTSDSKIIFARRGKSSSAGAFQIGVIGGTVENSGDPKQSAVNEIKEELGIYLEEPTDEDVWVGLQSLIYDRMGRPILVYRANLPYTSQEIYSAWSNSRQAQMEHSELIFVENTQASILNFAEKNDPKKLHPPADAILIEHLRSKFLTDEEDRSMGGMSA